MKKDHPFLAKYYDQKVPEISHAIDYRINNYKKNIIHQDKCMNL